ncbi:IS66 family insertion sequence element accessory protein TnpB [Burkholderia ubonensis]|uniref:IS66 family insertion sequence element accessory protein TnpB n=1 Tax=Burkholderia ubonensis TaxID=101571 RepID=UPI001E43BEC1|nr:IS66 family insertion sequence element accessory protein TnpB [Burkholderia ubonensis]
MGINGLSILVEQAMSLNPMAQALYVFGNRRRDRIKILAWDGNGFWLLLKRLEGSDRFAWSTDAAIVTLSGRSASARTTAMRSSRSESKPANSST